MSARRQPSTTSLSKFARTTSPNLQNKSLDFCNAFWGIADGGVDVLFARMRGAARTTEEMKNFWKERAAIEEDYAKRLSKLSKMTLGKDEIGELRNSLDTVRLETDRQAGYHQTLAQQIRTELEAQVATFHARQLHHKKTYQASIEKEFKAKQTQETYVNKAREKYESDCLRINSFTAQSSLVQGKDLEKIQSKLERAQQTVQSNERDFANFAKALHDTTQKWEHDWKAFCDSCQDLEEQRIEFMKDNMWAYANAVSTVCVSDDESCEHVRVALEQMEPEKDVENFVRDYGTGNQIPDPPSFVNYNTPDAIPSSSARPTSRVAHFTRNSQREAPIRQNSIPPPDDEPLVNTAGIGAGGGAGAKQIADSSVFRSDSRAELTRQPTARSSVTQVNGYSTTPPAAAAAAASSSSQQRPMSISQAATSPAYRTPPSQDPYGETIDPTAETFIKVGSNAYRVDLTKDPQQAGSSSSRALNNNGAASPTKQNGTTVDPLAKHLEELQNAVSSSGSVRRSTTLKKPVPQETKAIPTSKSPVPGGGSSSSALSPPKSNSPLVGASGSQASSIRDYRNSAEVVVGTHPMALAAATAATASRPTSPNPPTAAFMVPKPSPSPVEAELLQEVLADYQQALPGERKSISRSNSRRGSFIGQHPSQSPTSPSGGGHAHNNSISQLARPPSQVGHAGIGAHGGSRSNSPQPPSRGPSPAPPSNVNNYMTPPQQSGQSVMRATSPNTVGIALDPSGRVLHDDMAQKYQQQHQHQPQHQQQPQQQQRQMTQQQPPYVPPPPIVQQQQQQPQRRSSYIPPLNNAMATSPVQPPYGVTPSPQQIYNQPPPQQPSYVQPPPMQQPVYNPAPLQYQQPPPQQSMYQQTPPQQQAYGGIVNGGVQRGGSMAGGYYGSPGTPSQQQMVPRQQQQQQQQQQQPQQQQQAQRLGYQQTAYRDPSPVGRSPSPQPPPQAGMPPPTGQVTEEGAGILFYVKALYDYNATIEEEFDFQAGDIIAVTATPEDGWWSGELLDEARRQKGRHVFPSNFVCLF